MARDVKQEITVLVEQVMSDGIPPEPPSDDGPGSVFGHLDEPRRLLSRRRDDHWRGAHHVAERLGAADPELLAAWYEAKGGETAGMASLASMFAYRIGRQYSTSEERARKRHERKALKAMWAGDHEALRRRLPLR